MPPPVVSVPPLPTTDPGTSPWAAVAYPWGPADVAETPCSFWYFFTDGVPTPSPVYAGQFLTDLANHILTAVQNKLTYPICMWDPSAWLWDGNIVHSYTLDLTISDTVGRTATSWPGQILIQKWTDPLPPRQQNRICTGRWYMWPPTAATVNSDGTLNVHAVNNLTTMATQLFITPFVSQGVTWYP